MKTLYTLYIGADNNTGIVDKAEIAERLHPLVDGFTMIDTIGYWNGKIEQGVKIEIVDAPTLDVENIVDSLCFHLNQDSIMVEQREMQNLQFMGMIE